MQCWLKNWQISGEGWLFSSRGARVTMISSVIWRLSHFSPWVVMGEMCKLVRLIVMSLQDTKKKKKKEDNERNGVFI